MGVIFSAIWGYDRVDPVVGQRYLLLKYYDSSGDRGTFDQVRSYRTKRACDAAADDLNRSVEKLGESYAFDCTGEDYRRWEQPPVDAGPANP